MNQTIESPAIFERIDAAHDLEALCQTLTDIRAAMLAHGVSKEDIPAAFLKLRAPLGDMPRYWHPDAEPMRFANRNSNLRVVSCDEHKALVWRPSGFSLEDMMPTRQPGEPMHEHINHLINGWPAGGWNARYYACAVADLNHAHIKRYVEGRDEITQAQVVRILAAFKMAYCGLAEGIFVLEPEMIDVGRMGAALFAFTKELRFDVSMKVHAPTLRQLNRKIAKCALVLHRLHPHMRIICGNPAINEHLKGLTRPAPPINPRF